MNIGKRINVLGNKREHRTY